jgi:hypothetical protein
VRIRASAASPGVAAAIMASAERSTLALLRVSAADLFRAAFCACAGDARPLLLDARPRAAFARGHVAGAYCVRVSANAAALLDYSGGGQEQPWSAGAWWGKPLLLYGGDDAADGGAEGAAAGASAADGAAAAADATLSATHPVVAFLLAEGRASSVTVVTGGCVQRSGAKRKRRMENCVLACALTRALRARCMQLRRGVLRVPIRVHHRPRGARAPVRRPAALLIAPYWLG